MNVARPGIYVSHTQRVAAARPKDEVAIFIYTLRPGHGVDGRSIDGGDGGDDNVEVDRNARVLPAVGGPATYLDQRGYPSLAVAANAVYRKDTPGGILDFKPDISHRYLAVRSGVGLGRGLISPLLAGSVARSGPRQTGTPVQPETLAVDEKATAKLRVRLRAAG